MSSPRESSPRCLSGRRLALWSALAIGGLLPSVGCQVEYAGMTLPSGKYMMDDVQYFPSGPDFPWANTQAATQRARMSAMGEAYGLAPMPVAPGVGPIMSPPNAPGALSPVQNVPGRPTDVNVSPFAGPGGPQPPTNAPEPPVPGQVPPPGAGGPGTPGAGPSGGAAPDLGPR
jgi:hypothetical protein